MGKITTYARPSSIEEAVGLLKEKRGKAMLLAGGTSLALRLPPGVDTLVDLGPLAPRGVKDTGDSFTIGAWTTVAELAESRLVNDAYGGVLAAAARRVAATPLRNLITVGGNCIQVLPWSDLPGVFLALGAEFLVTGNGDRTIPANQFYATHPRKFLDPGDIVTAIKVPKPVGRAFGAYTKVSTTVFDYASLSVTAVCWFSGQQVRDCAVTLGSIRPLPVRVRYAEDEVVDRIPTHDDVVRAAARAAGAIEPSVDFRHAKTVRTQFIKTYVKRTLMAALEQS